MSTGMAARLVKGIVDKMGYEIRRKPDGRDLQPEAEKAIGIVSPYTMLPRPRLKTLYQKVAFCERAGIDGSLVECGVWKGGAAALMALANLAKGRQRRHIHLFDSFQEICYPDGEMDGKQAIRDTNIRQGECRGQLQPVPGVYDKMGGPGTLEGNKQLMEKIVGYDPQYLHYHVGWFQETMPREAERIGAVALLRLDGDWYASTKVCLEYLYDKVVSGGFVIIDDYGAYEGCRKAVDEFMSVRNIKAFLHNDDYVCRYWVKP